jgi:hypothetical protein
MGKKSEKRREQDGVGGEKRERQVRKERGRDLVIHEPERQET